LVTYIGPNNTVFVVIKVAPGHQTADVVQSLQSRLHGVDVYSKESFSRKTRLYWTIETGVGFAFLLTIIVSFLVGMLIVGQTIYNSTMEHIKEFGTLKALGAENFDVYKIIFSQALINALLGYLISLVITLATVNFFLAIGTVMVVRTWLNFLVLGLTLVMCLSAAAFSVRKIRTIDPAILFRG
jgi:putative ABC transport system permease protein